MNLFTAIDFFYKVASYSNVTSMRQALEIIGANFGDSYEDIKKKYKRKVLENHPDRNKGNPENTQMLSLLNNAMDYIDNHIEELSGSSPSPQASYESQDDYRRFYILDEDKRVIPASKRDWERFISKRENTSIAFDEIVDGVFVSTVFLGYNADPYHRGAPLVFEMKTTTWLGDDSYTYSSTWNEAVREHEKMVELMKSYIRRKYPWLFSKGAEEETTQDEGAEEETTQDDYRKFYILDEDKRVIPASKRDWERFISKRENTSIAFNEIADGVFVSTVFLGYNADPYYNNRGAPLVFEMKTSYSGRESYTYTSTWNEAVREHEKMVELMKSMKETEETTEDDKSYHEYYILDENKVAKPASKKECERFLRDYKNISVAFTKVSDNIDVSTVFLGHNYNKKPGRPLIFETSPLGVYDEFGEDADDMDLTNKKYSTWDEAVEGHKEMVEKIKDLLITKNNNKTW